MFSDDKPTACPLAAPPAAPPAAAPAAAAAAAAELLANTTPTTARAITVTPARILPPMIRPVTSVVHVLEHPSLSLRLPSSHC
jgi:hypothetical protein